MRRTLNPFLLRRQRPRARTGVLVAVLSVAAVTALIYPLKHLAPVVSLGVAYLLAVLLVSTYWGATLGVLTALASATAFNFFHLPPVGRFTITDSRNWVALAAFLMVALAAAAMAELARTRASEADDRRREADLAAEMAQLLLGGADLAEALALTSRRLAEAIEAPSASIELNAVNVSERGEAIALHDGTTRIGTLVLPSGLPDDQAARLHERIVPSLESLVAAALSRERLQAEVVETASLRRSDVMKTAVLRSVSHDLRTPVTAILAGAAALRASRLDAGERHAVETGIAQDADRLSRLIDKLLDLARLQAGTAEPHRGWCSIDEVLHEAVQQLAAPVGAFSFAIATSLPLVRADATQLERAFANLLENAARYSGRQPVSVRARAVGDRLMIRIVDRGPGIPAHEHERIFSAFYQSPDAPPGHDGSGLGLAITKGFIEANGGLIWVESFPGQGTSFVIELPLEQVVDDIAEPAHSGR